MSPHAVSSFVTDLVEMAKAMEEVPILRAEVDRFKEANRIDGETIARLEVKLIDKSNEIDGLNAKVRSLEVERDDASFREMEADDKAFHLLAALRSVQADVGKAIEAAMPAKPEPTPELKPAEPINDPTSTTPISHVADTGHREANPTADIGPIPSIADTGNVEVKVDVANPTLVTHTSDGSVNVSGDRVGLTYGEALASPFGGSPSVDAFSGAGVGGFVEGSKSEADPTAPLTDVTATAEQSGAATTTVNAQFDPEPTVRFSSEWYEWRDRQRDKVASSF